MRTNLASLPEFEIISERTVAASAPDTDMDIRFRRVVYLGSADTKGATRY